MCCSNCVWVERVARDSDTMRAEGCRGEAPAGGHKGADPPCNSDDGGGDPGRAEVEQAMVGQMPSAASNGSRQSTSRDNIMLRTDSTIPIEVHCMIVVCC